MLEPHVVEMTTPWKCYGCRAIHKRREEDKMKGQNESASASELYKNVIIYVSRKRMVRSECVFAASL